MKKLYSLSLIVLFLSSCSSFGPKTQILYERPDLTTKLEKVVIFPTTDFQGKSSEGSKSVEMSINASWTNIYGSDKTIPAGPAIAKISDGIGNDFYKNFITALDDVGAVEYIAQNETAKKFISEVTDKFGTAQFAIAIISGGEVEYNAGQPIHLHIGLFDANSLSWKLITKIEAKKVLIGNWKITSQSLVANSFDEIKKILNQKNK
jgi:hypothetical protein